MNRSNKLKKENWYKLLYIVSALAFIGFCIRLGADFYVYSGANLALPSVLILERCIEFLLPSVLLFISAYVVKKKFSSKK